MRIKKIYQTATVQVDWKGYAPIILMVIFLPPLLSIIYAVWYYLRYGLQNKKAVMQLMIAFAAYIAIVNCTKLHTGDQGEYWGVFEGIPKHGLYWAMTHIYGYRAATNGKEFMNGIYNYIGYYLTFGNYHLYIWINSLLMYMPFFWCTKKLFEKQKNGTFLFLAGIVFLTFFPYFFVLTFQLQRQFIAFAMIIYLFVLKAQTGQTNVWIILAALFTHSTTLFFIPMICMDNFYTRMSIQKWVKVLGGTFLLIYVLMVMFDSSLTTNLSEGALGYVVNRVKRGIGEDDVRFKAFQFYVFNIPLLYIVITNIFKEGLKRIDYIIFNSYLILFLFVAFYTSSELVRYRFSFMCYGYIGFILPRFMIHNPSINKVFTQIVALIIIILFYWYFDHSAFQYAPNYQTLLYPQFYHLFIETLWA